MSQPTNYRALERGVERLVETLSLVNLAREGISGLVTLSGAIEKASKAVPQMEAVDPKFREKLTTMSELGSNEIKRDFPLLHAQAAITMWSILETAVEDFVVDLIASDRSLLDSTKVSKLRVTVPLTRLLRLPEEERIRLLIQRIKQALELELAPGIGHFEPLLDLFGFGGPCDDDTKRTLVELGEVRNCLVHRGGVIDRKLLETCPWITRKISQHFVVTNSQHFRYAIAVFKYLAAVLVRATSTNTISAKET